MLFSQQIIKRPIVVCCVHRTWWESPTTLFCCRIMLPCLPLVYVNVRNVSHLENKLHFCVCEVTTGEREACSSTSCWQECWCFVCLHVKDSGEVPESNCVPLCIHTAEGNCVSAERLTRIICASAYFEEVKVKPLFAYLPTLFGPEAVCLNSIIQVVKG